uniref:Uncharacterized protein n=1 Tax=Amphimedon queenslandica TaxID=400682 RepID=A0A1X7T2N0_AMPQE
AWVRGISQHIYTFYVFFLDSTKVALLVPHVAD